MGQGKHSARHNSQWRKSERGGAARASIRPGTFPGAYSQWHMTSSTSVRPLVGQRRCTPWALCQWPCNLAPFGRVPTPPSSGRNTTPPSCRLSPLRPSNPPPSRHPMLYLNSSSSWHTQVGIGRQDGRVIPGRDGAHVYTGQDASRHVESLESGRGMWEGRCVCLSIGNVRGGGRERV